MSTTAATATSAPATSAPAATAQPAVADAVGEGRARIDVLDEQIITLVRARMTVSAGIQRARIAAGGRRVHLSREMRVLDRYRAELGRPGTALAMTLLELCRGRA